jgi:hypothetical protein
LQGVPELDLYAELRGWQAGIGALLGFFGLMLAALWNFRLNRKRDAALRREEMLSVAVALYGEILLLREELARLAMTVARYEAPPRNIPQRFADDHGPPEPILYPALGHKLGLLPAELVLAITKFHACFREAKDSLPLICRNDEIRFSVLTVLKPAVSGIHDVAPALRHIERLAGLSEAKEPKLGDAINVIEIEEERLSSV